MTDTTREAVERLARGLEGSAGGQDDAADTLRALFARADAAEKMVRKLVALNDDYSPFGGEILQDRVDKTWREACRFLTTLDHPKEGKDDE